MIIRATTATRDWVFGNGRNSYLINEEAVEANIRSKLNEWVGDCYFNAFAGVDYRNRLGPGQQAALAVEVKNVVLQCYGVVKILAFEASFNAAGRMETITMTLQTIFSPSAQIVVTTPIVGTT